MSLYLKYRPQDFKSLVGQVHAKRTIQSAFEHDKLAHAYLFCGPRGTGKTSMARIIAKRLNCTNPFENEPCGQCDICVSITNGSLVDLIEIDAASNRGIDEIRELRDKIMFAPSQAKAKVYIIDEVHMLTKEAFNALLKTLEEPPSHAYFILATTEAHKIPETIVSRCQQFAFSRIADDQISQRLAEIAQSESTEAEPEALNLIAQLSEGGLRDAIGLLEQMISSGPVTAEATLDHLGLIGTSHLSDFLEYLKSGEALKAIEVLNHLGSEGKSVSQFLKQWLEYLRQAMLSNLNESGHLMAFIEIFLTAKKQLDLSPIPQLPIEMAIIKACQLNSNFQKSPVTNSNSGMTSPDPTLEKKESTPVPESNLSQSESSISTPVSEEKSGPEIALIKSPAPVSRPVSEMPEAQSEQEDVSVKEGNLEASTAQMPPSDSKPPSYSQEKNKVGASTLTLEAIKSQWKKVLELVKNPVAKMSLAHGQLIDYSGEKLTINLNSSTFKTRASEPTSRAEIQEALLHVYGLKMELDLKTSVFTETAPAVEPESKDEKGEAGPSVADMAAEVFGV